MTTKYRCQFPNCRSHERGWGAIACITTEGISRHILCADHARFHGFCSLCGRSGVDAGDPVCEACSGAIDQSVREYWKDLAKPVKLHE